MISLTIVERRIIYIILQLIIYSSFHNPRVESFDMNNLHLNTIVCLIFSWEDQPVLVIEMGTIIRCLGKVLRLVIDRDRASKVQFKRGHWAYDFTISGLLGDYRELRWILGKKSTLQTWLYFCCCFWTVEVEKCIQILDFSQNRNSFVWYSLLFSPLSWGWEIWQFQSEKGIKYHIFYLMPAC